PVPSHALGGAGPPARTGGRDPARSCGGHARFRGGGPPPPGSDRASWGSPPFVLPGGPGVPPVRATRPASRRSHPTRQLDSGGPLGDCLPRSPEPPLLPVKTGPTPEPHLPGAQPAEMPHAPPPPPPPPPAAALPPPSTHL